jgi:mRNA interferase MazF
MNPPGPRPATADPSWSCKGTPQPNRHSSLCSADQQPQVSDAAGTVLLPRLETGLPRDSVANVSLIVALDKRQLAERVRKLPPRRFQLILAGIDTVLGR